MLLTNVTFSWVKLDPSSPDKGFDGKSPQYSVVVTTSDKAAADTWKAKGINVKPKEVDGAIEYSATLKKKIYSDPDGKNNTPPPAVVDGQLQPIADVSKIGNGSTGSAQVRFKPYDYMGRKGISIQLMACQITKLVEYNGGEALMFQAVDTDKEII